MLATSRAGHQPRDGIDESGQSGSCRLTGAIEIVILAVAELVNSGGVDAQRRIRCPRISTVSRSLTQQHLLTTVLAYGGVASGPTASDARDILDTWEISVPSFSVIDLT